MPRKPITDVAYGSISHYDWDEQQTERERRFRPRVEALGPAGTETLDEVLDYLVEYKRASRGSDHSSYGMSARAGFNALCRFMGIPIGKYERYDTNSCNAERHQFWQWCWEISEKRRLETARQRRLEL
jgi:hypothetical protein